MAGWTAQQLVEAFSDRDDKRYLIRDRDSIYGLEFGGRVQSLGIKEVPVSTKKPLAECVRRAADRIRSAGMPGARGRSQPTVPLPSAEDFAY